MAYKQPQTADFYLKLAYENLEWLRVYSEVEGDAPTDIPDMFKEKFTKAAQYLNAARKIDPTAQLERIDYSGDEPVTVHLTQDHMNAEVLFCEALAYHNCARAYMFAETPRKRRIGHQHLQHARDTLLHALKYANDFNIRGQLKDVYRALGDEKNLRAMLEAEVESDPDNIHIHQQIMELNSAGLKQDKMFSWFKMLPISTFTMIIIALMIIGLIIAATAPFPPPNGNRTQQTLGMGLFSFSACVWIYYKWTQLRTWWENLGT